MTAARPTVFSYAFDRKKGAHLCSRSSISQGPLAFPCQRHARSCQGQQRATPPASSSSLSVGRRHYYRARRARARVTGEDTNKGRRRHRTSGVEEEEEAEEEDVRSRRRRSCQPEMSDYGCIHLNNFKAAKGIQPYKVIHAYFVTSTSAEARIRKVGARPSFSRDRAPSHLSPFLSLGFRYFPLCSSSRLARSLPHFLRFPDASLRMLFRTVPLLSIGVFYVIPLVSSATIGAQSP